MQSFSQEVVSVYLSYSNLGNQGLLERLKKSLSIKSTSFCFLYQSTITVINFSLT